MEWKRVSENLLGHSLAKDVYNSKKTLIFRKDTAISRQMIHTLLDNHISRVCIIPTTLEKEFLWQAEQFILKSSQPLFWEEYIHMVEETKKYFFLHENNIMESPEYLLLTLHELINLLEDKAEFFEYVYSVSGHCESLYRHTVNVAILAHLYGNMKITLENPVLLSQMGYLHDIGKSKLDKDILNKPSKLTPEELEYVHSHTTIGVELLKRLGVTRKEILDAVHYHHELRNGTGYPDQLKKEEIPIYVQIISLLDAFDTICSDRTYKKRNTFFEALKILYFDTVEGKLNPIVVIPWIEYLYSLYINRNVYLSNGEAGKIYYTNPKEAIRPIIQLENESFLDLSQLPNLFITDVK